MYSPEDLAQLASQNSRLCWSNGWLEYKFHPTQQRIHDTINASKGRKFFVLCSRRLGKTHLLWTMAEMVARRTPYARVLYLAPTAAAALQIAQDTVSQVQLDCPEDLRPDFNSQERSYKFKNGSIIRLKGVNGETADNLRGTYADLIILDECAQMDRLKYVVSSVCMPMTAGRPHSRIVLATTPPVSPGHESATIYEELAGKGATAKFTIRDADEHPRLTLEEKLIALEETGEKPERIPGILRGELQPETTSTRREYFCEFVTDASSAVVKEYTEEARKDIVRAWPRPPHFDAYVSIDPGMRDRTGILFAYWDFVAGKLVIEDEALLEGPNTSQIANCIKSKEEALWDRGPYLRISDVDPRLRADLAALHGITVNNAQKTDAMGAVNLLRNWVQQRKLVIDPRCVHLDRQLRNAIWNRKGTDFDRGGEGSMDGHWDLLAALKYLCRAVNVHRNPYPEGWLAPGGPGGVARNTYISHKAARRRDELGIRGDTPLSRRLGKKGY